MDQVLPLCDSYTEKGCENKDAMSDQEDAQNTFILHEGRKIGLITSPTIQVTLAEGEYYYPPPNTPHRPSLDVIFSFPETSTMDEEVFNIDPSLNIDSGDEVESSFRQRSYTSGSKGSQASASNKRLGSLKSLFRDLSPKIPRRRRKSNQWSPSNLQFDATDYGTTDLTGARPKTSRPKLSLNIKQHSMDDESYFSENDKYSRRFRGKRHSLDDLLMGGKIKPNQLPTEPTLKKSGIMSSMKNLFHMSKSENRLTINRAQSLQPRKFSSHRRQASDSDLVDLQNVAEQEDRSRRRSTMDNVASPALRRINKAHKNHKLTVLIDKAQEEKSNSEKTEEGIDSLLSILLVMTDATELLDFEVQRLELSEVAAGIGRLKHAESNDHLMQMDDESTLSRIEKLFPNDDLELNSSSKKPRRRRSAPSQILLRNFRRSTTVGDVTSAASKLPQPTDYVSRKFIFESAVHLTVGVQTQDRYLFLFNDVLFIAKQRSATSYKLKKRVLVSDIWLGDSIAGVSEVSNLDPTKSFVIGWPTTNFVASFTTKELRDRWKEKLTTQINEERGKELVSSIDVEIVHKNAALEHMASTVNVDKQTDAKELLQIALQTFEIQGGKDQDYQLWVLSTKDDTVYPLFGHEQPFSIQLSHDRDADDDTENNIKCQFILRENKKQLKLERKSQKSTKTKKKMGLPGIFRKTSGKITSSPRSNSLSEGKIFGHPLDELCDPDIPTPLMELLENLYNCGPFTTEIFRKPSNAKRCQEMVNFMNSTEPEGWCKGCQNGILFASILKTFLRELPGKLCCSDMYNQWSNAINITKEDEKITQLQRIIEKMPRGNQQLLRYIVCILHHIQQRSHDNLMTSYNLAVCLGPSLLWNESSEMADQEASSKTVPQVVQYFIDNCQTIFGEDVIDMFGHLPVAPVDSDEELEESTDRIHTPYNDSLESLSDTEAPMGGLTQMSPSSCSRDSGLILSDPHEDGGEHSDDHSLRQQIIKSKSCDSLSQARSGRHLPPSSKALQTQVSSDSLNCDDEYVEINESFNYLLTKSKSGSHLCYDKEADKTKSGESRLKERLASLASRYTEDSSPLHQENGYTSSDSDNIIRNIQNDEWSNSKLQKSSTNSSIQQGSSSSDDALAIDVVPVTHRHINNPRTLESESGHAPTDFLRQFDRKIKSEEAQKKKIQELMRVKTDPSVIIQTDTDDEVIHSSKITAQRAARRSNSPSARSPNRITRTTSYAGRSERRRAPVTDLSMSMTASMAEKMPIMPQQYRPNRPPPYKEAVERREKMKTGPEVSEIERIKQTVNSARAKQLYAKSLQKYEKEKNEPSRPSTATNTATNTDTESITSVSSQSNMAMANLHNNNNTIGVVKTSDKKIVIKRASSTKLPPRKHTDISTSSTNIFYQPCTSNSAGKASVSSASLASSFYRPTRPPPYKEAMKRKTSKPDLIDSLGGESLV